MDWVVYNNSTKRTRYSSVPTSDITAETVVVDGRRATKKVTTNGSVTSNSDSCTEATSR